MRVLDRYIIKTVCGHIALVMAVLLTLLALFLFINEQGWVGVGRYDNLAALRYVLLNLPAAALQFLPVGAMIGSLLAMGQLARGSELTVMRASGVSIGRICLSVAMAGLLLLPLALLTGEWVAPPLTQIAREFKAVARSGNISVTHRGGAWVRDGERILRADGMAGGAQGGVTVFGLGPDRQLTEVARADGVRAQPDGSWELTGFAGTRFAAGGTEPASAAVRHFQTQAGAEFFDLVSASPRDLALAELARVTRHLQANGQDARRYRFAFWSGVARLVAIPLAVLLAVPFLFGALRSAEGGARATVGLVLGLVYYIAQRMVESGAMAFSLDPMLLAWLPTMLLAGAVGLLLARLR